MMMFLLHRVFITILWRYAPMFMLIKDIWVFFWSMIATYIAAFIALLVLYKIDGWLGGNWSLQAHLVFIKLAVLYMVLIVYGGILNAVSKGWASVVHRAKVQWYFFLYRLQAKR